MKRALNVVHVRRPVALIAGFLYFVVGAHVPPASAADDLVTIADGANSCAALNGSKIASSVFALPTGEATISEAVLIGPDEVAGLPKYCRVRGSIGAASLADPPILFQVNLPNQWNLKTVLYGGSGLNGVVVQATDQFKAGGGSVRPALARYYVTYGSDSGHQTPGNSFYNNAQATANYSHEAVKRSKDLASHLVKTYYGGSARRNYQIGGSKGGQEGLQAAQRYAADFDGVVSNYPAAQNGSLRLGWNRMWHFAFDPPGGSLTTAKQILLKKAVMTACDGLDGAMDGIVSNLPACGRAFKVESLRCPDGADTGDTCLSDRQIFALKDAAKEFTFAYPMPNGVRTVGPFPTLNGGDLQLWFGTGPDGTQQGFYKANKVRPEALGAEGISEAVWQNEVMKVATVYDASNPDLDAFKVKGGKMLLVQGTTDMLVPHPMTTHYFEALQRRYGANELKSFVRYYVVPGYGHGHGAFNLSWDSLAALDAWVETGKAPVSPVATDVNPQSSGRQRPLCEYPTWPKYKGAGDISLAESFSCATE